MPARVSEAIVLRTYPLREADLVVSFFTRNQGRLRGVAKRAKKPKSNFGSGLERLSHVEMSYYQRENRELVNLESCELIHSQFALAGEYDSSVALDFIAELSEQLLPPAEPNEKFFRLLLSLLGYLRREGDGGVWCAVTYFSLWAVRLSGFLPDLKLSPEEAEIVKEMLQKPIEQMTARQWSKGTAAGLRRRLVHEVEQHIERRLQTPAYLESL